MPISFKIMAVLLCLSSSMSACSQQIRILVVEARNGKAVTDECLNVSFGLWHGTDIMAPTDEHGIASLLIDGQEVSATPVSSKTCRGFSFSKLLSADTSITRVSVLPDWYVSCQYSKQLTNDPAWLNASPSQRIPSFSIRDILDHGIVATNSCSKRVISAKPGELVLVVRKRTFWEGMKS